MQISTSPKSTSKVAENSSRTGITAMVPPVPRSVRNLVQTPEGIRYNSGPNCSSLLSREDVIKLFNVHIMRHKPYISIPSSWYILMYSLLTPFSLSYCSVVDSKESLRLRMRGGVPYWTFYSQSLYSWMNLQTDNIIPSMPSFTCKKIKTKSGTNKLICSCAIRVPKRYWAVQHSGSIIKK